MKDNVWKWIAGSVITISLVVIMFMAGMLRASNDMVIQNREDIIILKTNYDNIKELLCKIDTKLEALVSEKSKEK